MNGASADVTVSVRVVAGEVRGGVAGADAESEPAAGDETTVGDVVGEVTPDAAQPARRTPAATTTTAELNGRIPGC